MGPQPTGTTVVSDQPAATLTSASHALPNTQVNLKMAASYLVVCFCATAGQNGENLGSDEEQIVLFVYILYDVTNNKVSTS